MLDALDQFDHFAMGLVSDWTQYSALLNKFIVPFLALFTVKTLPVFAGIWLLWFSADAVKYRPMIVDGFVGMFLAGAVSRAIQVCLPERLRPLNSGDLDFRPPLGLKTDILEHWSSFPSDHAAVFFALSTAIWLVSRPIGAISYAWTIFIICLPRLFGGYHYASDIIGGAVIGVLVASFIARPIGGKLSPLYWPPKKRRRPSFMLPSSHFHSSLPQCLTTYVTLQVRFPSFFRCRPGRWHASLGESAAVSEDASLRISPLTWCSEIVGELPIGSTQACNMGLQGMVSKRADRPYRAGRSNDWLKVKNRKHPAYRSVQEQF